MWNLNSSKSYPNPNYVTMHANQTGQVWVPCGSEVP